MSALAMVLVCYLIGYVLIPNVLLAIFRAARRALGATR